MIPIAIASENRSASISGRENATLITKIETVRTPATLTRRREKPRSPTWNAVSAWRLREAGGDLAERRRRAGRDDDAAPGALVDDRAHERAAGRSSGESLAGATAGDLATGSDSPVSTASSHSSCGGVEQPEVGRHDVADPQSDDVAGHEVGDVDRDLLAVAPDQRLVMEIAVERGDRVRRAELVEEAEADAERDDRGDDRGVGRVAGEARDGRRREQQQEQRVAQLAREDRERRHAPHRQRVRAVEREAGRGFCGCQALFTAGQAREHRGGR